MAEQLTSVEHEAFRIERVGSGFQATVENAGRLFGRA